MLKRRAFEPEEVLIVGSQIVYSLHTTHSLHWDCVEAGSLRPVKLTTILPFTSLILSCLTPRNSDLVPCGSGPGHYRLAISKFVPRPYHR